MKPKIPDVVADFGRYYQQPGNGAWGSLHIVLDDGNTTDADASFCIQWAKERGDTEGERLAEILFRMSPSQRGRLDKKVDEYLRPKVCGTRQPYPVGE